MKYPVVSLLMKLKVPGFFGFFNNKVAHSILYDIEKIRDALPLGNLKLSVEGLWVCGSGRDDELQLGLSSVLRDKSMFYASSSQLATV